MTVEQRIGQLREPGGMEKMVELIPYARFLGISVSTAQEQLVVTMRAQDRLIGNPVLPALHGGTVGALLEITAIFQVLWELSPVAVPKTINITIDYLRSGRIEDTHARASITKEGRRVANVQAWAWQGDPAKPIAHAHAHFLIRTRDV
jgi:uncharacterized protein (TIGR00369 family)